MGSAAAYKPAPQVREIAEELIADHHPHLRFGVRIEYLFRTKTPTSKGRDVWGKARKVTGLNAFLADDWDYGELVDTEQDRSFFVIEIAEPIWAELNDEGRRALVDHELCHCSVESDDDGDLKFKVVAHDVEEFQAVIARHGLWRSDVRRFATEVEQLKLDVPA